MEIPTGLPHEVVPLSWLIGAWEGTGFITQKHEGDNGVTEKVELPFRQRVEFREVGAPYLEYRSEVTLLAREENGVELPEALSGEMGYWRIARPRDAGDVGPALTPPTELTSINSVDAVEELRGDHEGFDLEVLLAHPTGVAEVYAGVIRGPRVDLATRGVGLTEGAEDYRGATRLYGLVQGRLFWSWDIQAGGQELEVHASAELSPVEKDAPASVFGDIEEGTE